MHWGRRVRSERERRGWTRVYLAERIEASEGTIRRLEELEAPPVRSKYALAISDLLDIGDDVVDSEDPRLSQASALQLAERLAEKLAEEDASAERHDQDNVRAVEWRNIPLEQTHSGDSDSLRTMRDADRDQTGDDAPPSPA